MSVPRLTRPLLMLVFAVACSSDRIPGRETDLYAAAAATCGPADGPAIEIYLAHAAVESLAPSAPYFRIAIWQPQNRLAGRSWTLVGDEADGGAWYHPTATDFEVATRGTVKVTAVAADSTIEGSADLTFPGGARLRGTFRAVWHPRQMLCG